MSDEHSPITLPYILGISPTLKIRGILASRDIKKGEILEKCPIILIPLEEFPYLSKTALNKYYYDWNQTHCCIVLGYGSLINHSYNPTAMYVFDYKNKFLVYKSIKDINKGEEITVNYNFDPSSKAKLGEELLDFNKHKPS
jgi:uncharacterized protein